MPGANSQLTDSAQCAFAALLKQCHQSIFWRGEFRHRLISKIRCWVERKDGNLNFHLTQLLSGHGCFRQYLNRFGFEQLSHCTWCGVDFAEDAENIIFQCGLFDDQRQRLTAATGQLISAENIVWLMILNNEFWNTV